MEEGCPQARKSLGHFLRVQVVTQLIDAKADMDFRLQTPLLSPLGLLFACMGLRHRWRASTLSTYAYHHENATPLMCSAWVAGSSASPFGTVLLLQPTETEAE